MKDLLGKRFGSLTVTEYAGTVKQSENSNKVRNLWKCVCDCGNEIVVRDNNLITGTTRSCGCRRKNVCAETHFKHGAGKRENEERLYRVWKSMKGRCNCANDKRYAYYGGKGIKVCDEWNDYQNFKEWALKNGYDENAEKGKCTIDRIDYNGNYCPENCRWVDIQTQANNTSRNHYIDFMGNKVTIAEFSRIMHIKPTTAWYYINKYEREKEEQTYSWCKGCKEYDTEKHCCHRYSSFIRESLQDSINAVLEDIKADIAEEICLTDNPYTEQTEYTTSHEKVLEIIDKHISGKEE